MKMRFEEIMAERLPETLDIEKSISMGNAWDDYGESLLDRAKIKILNPEYSVELYGQPWTYGVLNLKAQ